MRGCWKKGEFVDGVFLYGPQRRARKVASDPERREKDMKKAQTGKERQQEKKEDGSEKPRRGETD
eukprot:3715744-Pleurochrysis_carterae.AAC.1